MTCHHRGAPKAPIPGHLCPAGQVILSMDKVVGHKCPVWTKWLDVALGGCTVDQCVKLSTGCKNDVIQID